MPLDSSAFQSSDFIQRWLSDVSKNGKDLHDQEQAHDEHAGLRGYGNRIVKYNFSSLIAIIDRSGLMRHIQYHCVRN